MLVIPVPAKALSSILEILFDRIIWLRLEQFLNAPCAIEVKVLGNVISFRFLQLLKHSIPMPVTE